MKDLYLIGGGGHCRSCIDVIELQGEYRIAGIFDVPEKIGETILGYKIIDHDANIGKYAGENAWFLITLGQIKTADIRKQIFGNNVRFATIVSPLAHVSKHATIGTGAIIMHHALVNAGAQVGKNCIINTKALVEHDCVVGDHCHISTAAVLNGSCIVGEESFIGSNTVLKHARVIPPKSVVSYGEKA